MKKYIIFFVIISSINLIAVYFIINVNYFDYAKMPSDKNDTLIVKYKSMEEDGPSWYSPGNDSLGKFYLEPIEENLIIPEEDLANNRKFLLVGSFYYDEGIPRYYEMKTAEKPEEGRVFRYKSFIPQK
jgi:hypothetical protein